jgi:hypothetical protein
MNDDEEENKVSFNKKGSYNPHNEFYGIVGDID